MNVSRLRISHISTQMYEAIESVRVSETLFLLITTREHIGWLDGVAVKMLD